MDLADIAGLLTAGGVGGIAAKWIGDTSLRRVARADLLAALGEAERVFWSIDKATREDAVAAMERSALIAGAPVEVMALYKRGAALYDRFTRVNPDAHPDGRGPVFSMIDVSHEATVRLLTDWLWHPWLSRVRRPFVMRRIRARQADASQII